MKIKIVKATAKDVASIAPLYNQFREFYYNEIGSQSANYNVSNIKSTKSFLQERLKRNESIIFLANNESENGGKPIGFAQVFPTFSSVSMNKILNLNDIFILPEYRRNGIAKKLIEKVIAYGKQSGVSSIYVETSPENKVVQILYKHFRFEIDERYYHYTYVIR